MHNKLQEVTSEPSDRLRLDTAEALSDPTSCGHQGSSSRRTATRKDRWSFDVGRRAGQKVNIRL